MSLYDPALRYFLAVFEAGSIHAAARQLFVAVSAVSRQVSRLERDLGVTLFERHAGGVTATGAGKVFAGYARRTIQAAGQIMDELDDREQEDAVIAIAASPGIGRGFIPKVMADYRRAHHSVQFELDVTEPRVSTQLVRDGLAHLAVTFNLAVDSGVEIVHTQPSPLNAVMRSDHPLSGFPAVSLPDLHRYPLILPSQKMTSRRLFDVSSAAYGLPVRPALICDNPDASIRFVHASDAIALFSTITIIDELERGELRSVPLMEIGLGQRSLQVQRRSGHVLPAPLPDFTAFLVSALTRAQEDVS